MSEEKDLLNEKRELLKLKQGLIQESEAIATPDEKPLQEKPHGIKAVENFFYHYKWHLIIGAFLAFVLGFMIYSSITKEKPDLNVLVTTRGNYADLTYKVKDLENAFEMYCPDFDKNGKVHVNVYYIDMSSSSYNPEYENSNRTKLYGEIATGTAQLFIMNAEMFEFMAEASGVDDFFIDLSDTYPDQKLYNKNGVTIRGTEFAEYAYWLSCPNDIYFGLRTPFEGLASSAEDTADERLRAAEVLDNILNNRIINPSVKKE